MQRVEKNVKNKYIKTNNIHCCFSLPSWNISLGGVYLPIYLARVNKRVRERKMRERRHWKIICKILWIYIQTKKQTYLHQLHLHAAYKSESVYEYFSVAKHFRWNCSCISSCFFFFVTMMMMVEVVECWWCHLTKWMNATFFYTMHTFVWLYEWIGVCLAVRICVIALLMV